MTIDQNHLAEAANELPGRLKPIGLIGGLIGFAIMLMSPAPEGLTAEGWHVLAIAFLMAIWWMTEAVPISVTAMIPLVAIPFLGLGDIKAAAKGYTSKAIYLTLGGFIIGVALQRWNLHLRIAMNTVKLVGTEPRRVIAGFMIATAFLSMWITNTATTVMMLPIAYSVAMLLIKEGEGSDKAKKSFGIALMLGLAYSATIGGMMSLVGTSTNVMFKGFFEETYGLNISFIDWMKIGVPVGLIMLGITWFFLTRVMFPCKLTHSEGISTIINGKLKELGKMSAGESRTLFVFTLTAFLWVFKDVLAPVLPIELNDASIAIFGAILLFVIPSDFSKGEFLLRWEDTQKVPWGILLLLAGGLTLAAFLKSTGVADWMGAKVSTLHDIPLWVLVLLTTTLIIFLSELMSNVATLTAFLPVIVAVATGFGENPLLLAVPAALAASCAFMLPIGTPPNAVVFGSGLLKISDMARTGFILNLLGIIIINLISTLLLSLVFDVEHGVLPDWAQIDSTPVVTDH